MIPSHRHAFLQTVVGDQARRPCADRLSKWVPPALAAVVAPQYWRWTTQALAEDLVHHLGALSERGPELVAVDQLRGARAVVPGEERDVLHGDAVGR
jgi:hypothetical protein